MSQRRKSKASPSPSPIDWSRVRKVLLIRLRSIGDTVLMTPCLEALKEWQPGVEIAVVTEALAAPILEGHPRVDRLFVGGKSVAGKLSLASRLRSERFDLALNLHGGSTGMALAAVSGARYTVGFGGQKGSRLLNRRAPSPDVVLGRDVIHSVEQQLALLHWTGMPMPDEPRLALYTDPEAAAGVRAKLLGAGLTSQTLGSARFAIVAPGAAFESKRWSAPGFASVIDHLRARWRLDSVIVAGPGQKSLADEVARLSKTNPLVLSSVSVAELKALIAVFARVFVGNDSGPMHVAAAFDCPTVAMFGSSNPDRWHPWTQAPYRVLGGERGVRDSDIRGTIDRIEQPEVIAAVDHVLHCAATQAAS